MLNAKSRKVVSELLNREKLLTCGVIRSLQNLLLKDLLSLADLLHHLGADKSSKLDCHVSFVAALGDFVNSIKCKLSKVVKLLVRNLAEALNDTHANCADVLFLKLDLVPQKIIKGDASGKD